MRRSGWLWGVPLLLAACTGPAPGSGTPVTTATLQGDWSVQAIGEALVESEYDLRLRFDVDNALSGEAGCNRFTGSYSQVDDRLTFDPLATTRRLCSPPRMDREQRLFDALESAARARLRDGRLIILDEDGDTLLRLRRSD